MDSGKDIGMDSGKDSGKEEKNILVMARIEEGRVEMVCERRGGMR